MLLNKNSEEYIIDSAKKFPIVVLGGSAGSLSAIENFFVNTPTNCGVAFVIIQHLNPEKDSLLPDLIRRNTNIAVVVVFENTVAEPNHIYIIPPGKNITIKNNRFYLEEIKRQEGFRYAINIFLESLAKENDHLSGCVIFSGMGNDGSEGVKKIKTRRGLTLVQKPNTAFFDSMPLKAIETGMVDYILPVEDLPAKILEWAKNLEGEKTFDGSAEQLNTSHSVKKIIEILLLQTGHDFSQYKNNTICRRIESRMSNRKASSMENYADYLLENEDEISILMKELLIGVTSFFRDEEAFEILKTKVIPPLLRSKRDGESIRVWVSACCTGEEAYSIAMLLKEVLEDTRDAYYKIQIFGTDLDSESIDFARKGIYSLQIAKFVSEDRLTRFFIKKGIHYHIKKEIRDMVIFAQQSVIKDPPFTKVDILSCRNLLIYFTSQLQQKVLNTFRYALNPNGILFLGGSETIGSFADVYLPIEAKARIFKKRESITDSLFKEHFKISITHPKTVEKKATEKPPFSPNQDLSTVLQKELLHNFAPPSVVIKKNGDIVYTNGETGKYLQLPPGPVTLNILQMAREGLRFDLNIGIQEVIANKTVVIRNDVIIKLDGSFEKINLKIKPFLQLKDMDIILIVFEKVSIAAPIQTVESDVETKDNALKINLLQEELSFTKKNLQSTIEEMEISIEELTSAIEETQSTNEELQSSNEELTTSKEEMQSLNEELTSVNIELQNKVIEFQQSTGDIRNILQNTDSAFLFLDGQLNVKRFSPAAAKIIKLISTDSGRPISDITTHLKNTNLAEYTKEVLDTLAFKEFEAESESENWYRIKISPYRTIDNFIEGAIIVMTDISETKRISESMKHTLTFKDKILESMRDAVILMDTSFIVLTTNNSYYHVFNETSGNTLNKNFFLIKEGQWNLKPLRDAIEKAFRTKDEFNSLTIKGDFGESGPKKLKINGRIIAKTLKQQEMLLLVIEEIFSK